MTRQSKQTLEQNAGEVLIGGVEKRPIEILEYDPAWPAKFQEHARRVASTLGEVALQIEHAGSTSVSGLAAKPIIDMLVIVPDSRNEASYLPAMEAVGYELRVREPEWHEHRMFRTLERDVHLHIFSVGCSEVERMLLFRNHLRRSAGDRALYESTKRQLAGQDWSGMDAYARAKTEVIEQIMAKAQGAALNNSEQ